MTAMYLKELLLVLLVVGHLELSCAGFRLPKIRLPKVRLPKIKLPEVRLGVKRGARKVAQAAEQAEAGIKDAQKLIKEEAWPEVKEKLGQFSDLSDAAMNTLRKIDGFVDRANAALELLTRILALILMLVGAFLCRLAISNIQTREYTVCSSLQRSVYYVFYIFCVFVCVYFAFEVLYELKVLDRGEEYPLMWLFLAVVPLLEAVCSAVWYSIQGSLSFLCVLVCGVRERLPLAVLCAVVVLGVAVYAAVVGSHQEVEETD